MELISGTHKRWDTPLEQHVRLEQHGHINSEALPEAVLINLAPGDMLIFNAQMIHRGNYTLNKTRKALDLCVGKAHELVNATLDPKVLPNAEELAEIEHSQWYDRAWQLIAAN